MELVCNVLYNIIPFVWNYFYDCFAKFEIKQNNTLGI